MRERKFTQGSNPSETRTKLAESPEKRRRHSRAVMNQKRVKLLDGIAQGMNISEAGRYAGYGTRQASHRAYERLKLEMPERLNKLGCPVDRVLTKVIEKLDAEESKINWYKGKAKSVNVVAHDIQLDAADMLLRLHNAYPRNGGNGHDDTDTVSGPSFNLVISEPEVAKRVVGRLANHQTGALAPETGRGMDQDEGRAGPAESVPESPKL